MLGLETLTVYAASEPLRSVRPVSGDGGMTVCERWEAGVRKVLSVLFAMQAMMGNAAGAADSEVRPMDHGTALLDLGLYEDIQLRLGQDPETTLIVAISGGGYRAANFALGALLAMEQVEYRKKDNETGREATTSNLLNEVDYFSTVSGGGLAAAMVIMSRLQAIPKANASDSMQACSGAGRHLLRDWMSEPGIVESLRENHTVRLLTSKFALDVAFSRKTSGDALQMRLDESILMRERSGGACGPKNPKESYVLGDVLRSKTGGAVPTAPYWFMNATNLATGQIVPLSPGWIGREMVTTYWHDESRDICAVGAQCGPFGVPLALALRSSMNFPPAIPPTRLETQAGDFIYLTDGGESDNLGSVTAVDILNQEGGASLRRDNRRMLIVIDAFRGLGRKEYNTAAMPGLIDYALRTTSLPLDAHRFRVKRDLYHVTSRQPSVLDAISDSSDVSVVYVDMERELDALEIGTNLQLSRTQQEALICAGKRQALMALGKMGSWKQVRWTPFLRDGSGAMCPESPEAATCPSGFVTENQECRAIVAFNRSSKARLVGEFAERFKSNVTRIRQRVRDLQPYLNDAVETASREHRHSRILQLLTDEGTVTLPAATVNLKDDDLNPFKRALDRYEAVVNSSIGELKRPAPVERTDLGNGGATQEEESRIDQIIDWLKAWWNDLFAPSEEDGGRVEPTNGGDASNGDTTEEEDAQPATADERSEDEDDMEEVDDEAKNKMLVALDDMLRIAGEIKAASRKKTVRSGDLGELSERVSRLTTPHNDVAILLMDLETGDSQDLREKLEALAELMGEPRVALDGLREAYEKRLADALKRLADASSHMVEGLNDALSRWGRIDEDVQNDVNAFRKSTAWREVASAATVARDLNDIDARHQQGQVCSFLKETKGKLEDARRHLNGLNDQVVASALQLQWSEDNEIADEDLPTFLGDRWDEARWALEGGIVEAETLWCLWPDVNQRDRFAYDQFQQFHSLVEYKDRESCDGRDALPYQLACRHEDSQADE